MSEKKDTGFKEVQVVSSLVISYKSEIELEYYLNYIDYFADVSYGYCITVHKSQGSTFNKVYIDAKNILEYNRKGYINYKCLYTAITRASEKVLMFI